MSALDQSETYQRLDPSRLRSRVAGLPDQCRRAWEEASALDLPTAYAGARKVVVVGMGGLVGLWFWRGLKGLIAKRARVAS